MLGAIISPLVIGCRAAQWSHRRRDAPICTPRVGWGTCVMTIALHGDATGIVRCPGCDAPMRLTRRAPLLFSNTLLDITYRCDACEMLTQQTVKRKEPGAAPGTEKTDTQTRRRS